ncbi:hypothetical protein OUZ56_027175 [Daphnia magna]|uniref:Transmembrane protein n=1 Tax=Daphnia magna TaxID=35525 RepID=A0ABQ9ZP16_9CRUS|nr:hypothetical protein OUZ56_027175 [Daphnia magna]
MNRDNLAKIKCISIAVVLERELFKLIGAQPGVTELEEDQCHIFCRLGYLHWLRALFVITVECCSFVDACHLKTVKCPSSLWCQPLTTTISAAIGPSPVSQSTVNIITILAAFLINFSSCYCLPYKIKHENFSPHLRFVIVPLAAHIRPVATSSFFQFLLRCRLVFAPFSFRRRFVAASSSLRLRFVFASSSLRLRFVFATCSLPSSFFAGPGALFCPMVYMPWGGAVAMPLLRRKAVRQCTSRDFPLFDTLMDTRSVHSRNGLHQRVSPDLSTDKSHLGRNPSDSTRRKVETQPKGCTAWQPTVVELWVEEGQ